MVIARPADEGRQRQAEEALGQSEERFRLLVEGVKVTVVPPEAGVPLVVRTVLVEPLLTVWVRGGLVLAV